MKKLFPAAVLLTGFALLAAEPVIKTIPNPWAGKRVAFLGDSITDARHIGTAKNYWQYLEEYLGIRALCYGRNGWTWGGTKAQTAYLLRDHKDQVDAILVFMGTNDFNAGIPLGQWYDVKTEQVNADGKTVTRARRTLNYNGKTFRGTINCCMAYLKKNYPRQQIILLTPIHRGYAAFGKNNVQPEESYANKAGLFIDDYVRAVNEAGSIWSVPVIDLYRLSGLYPVMDEYTQYFHDAKTDRLHPNAAGHDRLAKTLMYQLLALPPDFR